MALPPSDDALAAVSEALLGMAGDLSLDGVLHQLVAAARRLGGADYAALGTPDGDGGFACWITDGMSDETIDDIGPLPRTHGVLGAMLEEAAAHRTDDVRSDPRFGGWWPEAHPEMQPFLAVPIVFRGTVVGAFYLANDEGGARFSTQDQASVVGLAQHAAVLIEHARLYEQSRELTVTAERNRLARELHDAMTQTMFSLRLTLETASSALGTDPEAAAAPLDEARRLVDLAFDELRSLVFQLRPAALDDDGLVASLERYLHVYRRAHGLHAALVANEAIVLSPETERQVFRIVQEALTNVVRHSSASNVEVQLAPDGPELRVRVVDDGAGFDPDQPGVAARHLGLTSMRERAEAVGGTLSIRSAPGHGTGVEARVPRG
ncbi:MAG TPA: GAF domain-containing sensor histidine kinase [Acidimicrobiales bacterium]|nr:GAF domain-containing sensor histidine kinase [Acidimicrobiales bacterium]